MTTSSHFSFSRYLRLFLVLIAFSFFHNANAQTGGPIAGYAYLGSCTVGGQPHYYYVSTTSKLWPDAKAAATGIGGYLATLTSIEENDCVYGKLVTYLNAHGGLVPFSHYEDDRNPWIGLTDDPSQGTTETHFIWANGENCSTFRHWDQGEPNNFNPNENFTQLLAFQPPPSTNITNGKAGFWNDWFNNDVQTYIVEFGPNPCIPVCTLTVSASLPALSCDGPNVIYLGYGPQCVTATSNQAGTTFKWYMVGNPVAVSTGATFCPTQSGTYYVVATNGACKASTAGTPSQIKVIDIRCKEDDDKDRVNAKEGDDKDGNNGKVYVCHKKNGVHGNGTIGDEAHTLCVSVNAVKAHLAHGDCLGKCPGDKDDKDDKDRSTSRLSGSSDITSVSMIPSKSETISSRKGFAISGYPNPSRAGFNIQLDGLSTEKVSIKVTDITGRIVEQRFNITPNQAIKIGENYRVGMYYIEVAQGANKQQLKLVKQ